MRNLELPGRSPAHGLNGMAATSHTLSTMAAISILQRGGNAMDAAITACRATCGTRMTALAATVSASMPQKAG